MHKLIYLLSMVSSAFYDTQGKLFCQPFFVYFFDFCKDYPWNAFHIWIATPRLRKGIYNDMLDRLALILVIIGAVNWGSIGLFQFDIVAWIFGGQAAIVSRIVYTLVALCGAWCISLLFRRREVEVSSAD
jgi:uncharacterized membrane protein YuzA (DUF378 family)